MPDVEEKVLQFIREKALIVKGDRVLAAVSGGLDSMVLLQLLRNLSGDLAFSISAAHFNHGLRGAQGGEEAGLVRRRCEALGIPFISGSAAQEAVQRWHRKNLQAQARQARYEFLRDSAEQAGCNRIATGHHQDDQAETVLLRLLSGSALFGLAGIRPAGEAGRLIRPLLAVSRAELEGYARENSLPWAEDPTNATDKYLRNRLRHQVIPEITRKYDARFKENLVRLGEEAADLTGVLEERVRPLLERAVAEIPGRGLTVRCQGLSGQPAILRRYLLRQAVYAYTGGRVILSGRPLNATERLLLDGPGAGRVDLPGGLAASREFELLVFRRKKNSGTNGRLLEIELNAAGLSAVNLGDLSWEITLEQREGGISAVPERHRVDFAAAWFEELFDLDKLQLPLSAGTWQAGDTIRPFGLESTQKLKKVFAARRIPRGQRFWIPVIREADRQVLWVCGVVRAGRAAVSLETKRVLVIRARYAPVEG